MARMPCRCRRRRSYSESSFIWGRTAVDLNSVGDSVMVVGVLVFVTLSLKKKENDQKQE